MRASRPVAARPVLRRQRRAVITAPVGRGLRRIGPWLAAQRYPLLVVATVVCGVASAWVLAGVGAALAAGCVGCGFMAWLVSDDAERPPWA